MMRVSAPNTTDPGRAGALAASALAAASAAAALATPATSATRTPPAAGTVNSCERIVSPSTMASAVTGDPAGTAMNCARPCASVTAVAGPSGVTSVTSWLGTLLPMRSRTTRTVTAALGSSAPAAAHPTSARHRASPPGRRRAGAAARKCEPAPRATAGRNARLRPASPAPHRTACRTARRRRSRSGRSRRWCPTWPVPRAGRLATPGPAGSDSARQRRAPRPTGSRSRPSADQAHGAPAQAVAHLLEVGGGRLAHRVVELELLDRSQHQRLLTFEGLPGMALGRRRFLRRTRYEERPQRLVDGDRDEARARRR